MNRRIAVVFTVICSLLVATSARAAQAAEAGVDIRQVDFSEFPDVTITVSIEGADEVATRDISLLENGLAVETAELQSLAAAGRKIDIVLAIDTSGSMAGAPLSSAVAAALRFTTTLPEEIRLGIVTFSDEARVVSPLTSDHSDVLQSLGSLEAKGETSLYDAVGESAQLFSGDAQRNIILLSDGADTASRATLKSAASAARHAEATIFAVGLNSPDTDVGALRTLAQMTDGRYAPAATARLATVYQDLATELGNQYLLTYRSDHESGGEVDVTVGAFGATDHVLVLAPKVERPAPPPQVDEPATTPLLSQPWALGVVLGLCFLAVFLTIFMLGGSAVRNRRDRELAKRMRAAAPGAPDDDERTHGFAAWIPDSFVRAGEAVADVGDFGSRIDARLERAGVPLRAGEFISGTAIAAIAGALLGAMFLTSIVFVLLVAAVSATVPTIVVRIASHKRTQRLHGQLADVLMILASSLRAGHSFFQALDMVAKEVSEPGSEEFGRVVAEIRLGRPLHEAMNALAERIGSDDFKWAVLAVNIQREVGGNLAEVLDTVADTVRERETIRRQIDVLTAEGRLSVWILTALPICVALYIAKVNPGYMNLLFSTRVGLVMTAVAGSLLAVGIYWMRKVVKIDV